MHLLFDAGDRLLAARREMIDATRAFEEARILAVPAVADYNAAQRAAGHVVEEGLPPWPTVTAGRGYVDRDTRGQTAYGYAIQRQDAAEKHWNEQKALHQRTADSSEAGHGRR